MKVCKLPKSNTRHKTIIHKLLINKQLIQALKNMKKKELYTAPQTEQIILGSDQGILSGSPYGNEGEAGKQSIPFNLYGEDF